MIVWRGYGILALIIGAIGGGLGTALGQALGASTHKPSLGTALGLIVAGVAIWFAGNALNRPKPGYHPATGQPVTYVNGNTLFWIPMQYWGPLAGIIGVVLGVFSFA